MIIDDILVLGLLIVLIVAFVIFTIADLGPSYYFHIEDSKLDKTFKTKVREILLKSPINDRFNLVETTEDKAEIFIKLKDRDFLEPYHSGVEYYPNSSKRIRFSITVQKPNPTVFIDVINWLEGVPESGLTLDQYRTYVIQHEFMHALGFDHQPCNKQTAKNGVCPVMYQSTRGPPNGFKAGFTVEPVDYTYRIEKSYFR